MVELQNLKRFQEHSLGGEEEPGLSLWSYIFMFAKYPAIRHLRWASGVSLLILGACGGGSGTTMSSMMPPTGSMSQPLMATFDSIQSNIFTPLCSSCHSGANPPENLALDAMHSYNDLINVPSTEEPSVVRVKPGDPMHSFLVLHIQKEGDGASATDLSFIEQWITDGAPPSATAMSMADKFEITAVEPDSGDKENAPPPRIIVGFTQELDANRLDGTSVLLEHVEDDAGSQAVGSIIPANVSIPAGNAHALIVTPSSALMPGSYQVVMDPTEGTEVGSIGGASLSAPARSVNGGRVVTRFSVASKEGGESPAR
jgi:hypothetical protein